MSIERDIKNAHIEHVLKIRHRTIRFCSLLGFFLISGLCAGLFHCHYTDRNDPCGTCLDWATQGPQTAGGADSGTPGCHFGSAGRPTGYDTECFAFRLNAMQECAKLCALPREEAMSIWGLKWEEEEAP